MVYLAFFLLTFTVVRLLIVFSNVFLFQWLGRGKPKSFPLISVLIPARNEEDNLGKLLFELSRHDYDAIEVHVYDDLSQDRTYSIARGFANKDNRFHAHKGGELPKGWMGKTHACHRLASHAKGEYFLFLDADVIISKGLLKNALSVLQKHELDLLSVFPVQQMKTHAEKATVPLINWILTTLLPIIAIRNSGFPFFSAANGQFMLFKADTYKKELFHKAQKDKNTEDIAIARDMKRKGYRIHALLGNNRIQCRMYHSWDESVRGFSRNLVYFFGGSRIIAFLFGLITTFGFLPILFSLSWKFLAAYFSMVLVMRLLVSFVSRQNPFINIAYSPIQQLALLYIVVRATWMKIRRSTEWKGRIIDKI